MPLFTLMGRSLLILRLPRWLRDAIAARADERGVEVDAEILAALGERYDRAAELEIRLSILDGVLAALERDGDGGVVHSKTYRIISETRDRLRSDRRDD